MPEDAEPPTIDDGNRRAIIDAEHLRLLGLGYYLSAAMTAFFALFGLLYMGMPLVSSVARRRTLPTHRQRPSASSSRSLVASSSS